MIINTPAPIGADLINIADASPRDDSGGFVPTVEVKYGELSDFQAADIAGGGTITFFSDGYWEYGPTAAEFQINLKVKFSGAGIKTETQQPFPMADALAQLLAELDLLKQGLIFGEAATGTLSTTQASTNLSGYAVDQLVGAYVIWLSGSAEGERKKITANSAGGVLTFDALTVAPLAGDTFKIA